MKIPRIDVERNATLGEDAKYDVYALVKLIAGPKPRLSKSPSHVEIPRLWRLLEPLRVLHSIGSPYIDTPISERYRKEIQTSLSRARLSIIELFSLLRSAYAEAMMVFRAGHLLSNAFKRRNHSRIFSLARAHLKFSEDVRHVRAAQSLAHQNSQGVSFFDTFLDGGHQRAMTCYLKAEVWEALDQLGEHNDDPRCRSEALEDVIGMLTEALQYEPENPTLQQELERRRKEKANAEALENQTKIEKW